MGRVVEWVRWLNHALPFHHMKPSLAKRAAPHLPRGAGLQVYAGIAGDLRMRLDLDIKYECQIYLNARDNVLLSLLRRILRPGDTAVDCGANLGLLTLVAARCVGSGGRVHAFEPAPEVYQRLVENLVLNGVTHVTPHPLGVWHERSTATLYSFAGLSHDNASLAAVENKQVASGVTIECVPLDDCVQGPVRLIKIDVEGAEWPALRGAQRLLFEGPAPHLILEANPRAARPFGYHPLELIDWLIERRPAYRIHLIRSRSSQRIALDELRRYLGGEARKAPNLWFEPR